MATALSTCLSGEAHNVYGRLKPTDAFNYGRVKAALKRFRFTVKGLRDKFRTGKSADGETATQFATRLSHYIHMCTEVSETAPEYGALGDLLIKEKFLISCQLSLSLCLKEAKAKSLQDMLELADQFFFSVGRHHFLQDQKRWARGRKETGLR
ncbi:hypothetical protein HPB49_017098 [Dermacentor silvarum]|uniref:Uncharacterized protein n=1 Tax=Dermacentor silvarum TaxID=543639 RepID=A0ACB8CAA1_DERSI|nr:hypothetical protein HPB49_017098 [Dermacentor silvarum]